MEAGTDPHSIPTVASYCDLTKSQWKNLQINAENIYADLRDIANDMGIIIDKLLF
jgi:hypothetical protein